MPLGLLVQAAEHDFDEAWRAVAAYVHALPLAHLMANRRNWLIDALQQPESDVAANVVLENVLARLAASGEIGGVQTLMQDAELWRATVGCLKRKGETSGRTAVRVVAQLGVAFCASAADLKRFLGDGELRAVQQDSATSRMRVYDVCVEVLSHKRAVLASFIASDANGELSSSELLLTPLRSDLISSDIALRLNAIETIINVCSRERQNKKGSRCRV